MDQLNRSDSQRPYVRLEVITSLLYNLRSHPKWCTNKRIPLRFDIRKLRGNSKVCKLDLARSRQQHIRSLDVSVYLAFLV